MLPAGLLADRLAHHPQQRFGDDFAARRLIMRGCAAVTLIATLVIPFVAGVPWLAAPVAFVWGGAGGCLYTMVMIDIGSREEGITLVNSTAVLVLSYTLGGVLAPALGAASLAMVTRAGLPGAADRRGRGRAAGCSGAAAEAVAFRVRLPRRRPPVRLANLANGFGAGRAGSRPHRRRSTCPPA